MNHFQNSDHLFFHKKPVTDWDNVDLDSLDPFATSKPKQPAGIDWDNVDINNLDPFATKSKVSNNASSSSNLPTHKMSIANPCTPPRNNIQSGSAKISRKRQKTTKMVGYNPKTTQFRPKMTGNHKK